jgi:protein CpxP
MLRRTVLVLLFGCVMAASARAAEADRSPNASPPDDEITMPSPGEQSAVKRPPFDPVEERIKYLHQRLRITAAQEPLWSDVARAMRENARTAAPLIRDRVQSSERGNALQNLDAYEKLGAAQLDGLNRFHTAFAALYDKLSPQQKKIADSLFRIGPLGMIGGIPQLAEDLITPPPELPLIAGAGYVPNGAYLLPPVVPTPMPSISPVVPIVPSYTYPPVFPPLYPIAPFYAYGPFLWPPPLGVLIAGSHGRFHPHGMAMPHPQAVHGAGMPHH